MKGFTLIELIVVVFIILILGALSVPFFQSFQVSSDLYTLTDEVTRTLRNVQTAAWAGQNNSAWGVYFNETGKKYILYKGSNYDSRDQTFDLVYDYKNIFSISTNLPNNEIIFKQYNGQPLDNAGQPLTTATITLTSQNNQNNQININSLGLVDANY